MKPLTPVDSTTVVTMTVNGQSETLHVSSRHTLLASLREDLRSDRDQRRLRGRYLRRVYGPR